MLGSLEVQAAGESWDLRRPRRGGRHSTSASSRRAAAKTVGGQQAPNAGYAGVSIVGAVVMVLGRYLLFGSLGLQTAQSRCDL